ncbi:MAG: 30S ribosomal protein S17 [Candidatus Woesearchaeota archaeon]
MAKKEKTRKIGIEVKAPKEVCEDPNCPFHGKIKLRGRIFKGKVIKVDLNRTATAEWERLYHLHKYERFEKRRSKIRVHNPPCINASVGDKVTIAECRPISKTKSSVIIEKEK